MEIARWTLIVMIGLVAGSTLETMLHVDMTPLQFTFVGLIGFTLTTIGIAVYRKNYPS